MANMLEGCQPIVPEFHGNRTDSRKRSFDTQSPIMDAANPNQPQGQYESYESPPLKKTNYGSGFPLLKILIPNFAAGALIGRNGVNIAQIQAAYGAKIRLSSNSDFYPSTHDRIAIITGEIPQIIEMMKYILDKINIDPISRESVDSSKPHELKIIIPNATAGLVIGKGGSTIKHLTEKTSAKIIITAKDQDSYPGERIITVSGTTPAVQAACNEIIPSICIDPENMANKVLSYDMIGASILRTPLDLQSTGLGAVTNMAARNAQKQAHASMQAQAAIQAQAALQAMTGYSPYQISQQNNVTPQYPTVDANLNNSHTQSQNSSEFKTKVSIEMQVPDLYVGAVLGKGGKIANELMQYSGARIQFSAKGEYAQGTSDRILKIQGDSMTAAQIAHFLVCQKLDQAKIDFHHQGVTRNGYL